MITQTTKQGYYYVLACQGLHILSTVKISPRIQDAGWNISLLRERVF